MEPAVEGDEGILVEDGRSVGVQRVGGRSSLGVRLLLEVAVGDDCGAARGSRSVLAGGGVVGHVVVATQVVDADSLRGHAGARARRRQRRAMRGVGKDLAKGGLREVDGREGDEYAETVGEGGFGAACR